MTAPILKKLMAASLLVAASANACWAQLEFNDMGGTAMYVDHPDHDLQLFAPVDFDYNCRPIKKECGYFFRYDKLNWAMTGERNEVGDPNVQVFSEIIVPEALAIAFGVTDRDMPAQYEIINGLVDVPPFAQFAWGERYELGYGNGEASLMIGILAGPEVNASQTFGTGPQESGFGSIHVNFATPPDFLLGFRDYWGNGDAQGFFISPTPTNNGPGGESDGIPDDLDGDGSEGAQFIVADIDGDGTIGDDEVVGIAVDLDDLHLFNVTFDEMTIRNSTLTQGVELMKTHHLDNRHLPVKRQNEHMEFGYGVRFMRLRDRFTVDGFSPLLGTAGWDTTTENQIVGPQIRAAWSKRQGRLGLNIDGRFVFGYNVTDFDQRGYVGLDEVDATGVVVNPGLIPGGINRLLSGQPTVFSYGKQEQFFSPLAELRAEASYQITTALAAKLGYTAIYVDSISRASQVTRYYLPDMGLLDGGKQNIFINGVNLGFDVVY